MSRNRVIVQEDVASTIFERFVSWLHIYTWQPEWPISSITEGVRNNEKWQELFEEEDFSIQNKRRIRMLGLPITRYEYLLEQKQH